MSWEDIVKKRKPWSIYNGLKIDRTWLKKNYPEVEYVGVEVKHLHSKSSVPISVKWLKENHPEMLEAWKDHRDKEDKEKGLEIRPRKRSWEETQDDLQ
tara:strand:+ start:127 stop:420 length:294 start_codon:yes stop_codon:yes gene_type:complete